MWNTNSVCSLSFFESSTRSSLNKIKKYNILKLKHNLLTKALGDPKKYLFTWWIILLSQHWVYVHFRSQGSPSVPVGFPLDERSMDRLFSAPTWMVVCCRRPGEARPGPHRTWVRLGQLQHFPRNGGSFRLWSRPSMPWPVFLHRLSPKVLGHTVPDHRRHFGSFSWTPWSSSSNSVFPRSSTSIGWARKFWVAPVSIEDSLRIHLRVSGPSPWHGVPSERLRLVKRFISHRLHTGAWGNLVLLTTYLHGGLLVRLVLEFRCCSATLDHLWRTSWHPVQRPACLLELLSPFAFMWTTCNVSQEIGQG